MQVKRIDSAEEIEQEFLRNFVRNNDFSTVVDTEQCPRV